MRNDKHVFWSLSVEAFGFTSQINISALLIQSVGDGCLWQRTHTEIQAENKEMRKENEVTVGVDLNMAFTLVTTYPFSHVFDLCTDSPTVPKPATVDEAETKSIFFSLSLSVTLSLFILSFRPTVRCAWRARLAIATLFDWHASGECVCYTAGHQVVTGCERAKAANIRIAKEEEWKWRRKAVNILQPIRMKYVAWLFALLLLLLWHTSFIINAEREIISALRLIYVRRCAADTQTQTAHAMCEKW